MKETKETLQAHIVGKSGNALKTKQETRETIEAHIVGKSGTRIDRLASPTGPASNPFTGKRNEKGRTQGKQFKPTL